jgi:ankyrin repeat protein
MDVNEYSKRRTVGFRVADTTDNDTALHRAIEGKGCEYRRWFNGRLSLASLLLEWGARVHAKDYYGRTPLHLAADKGDSTLIQLLLDHKADVNAIKDTGETPLYLAVQCSNWDRFCPTAVKILLDHGADVNAVDDEGLNALHEASSSADPTMVKILLDAGATVNASSNGGYATLGAALMQIDYSCPLSIISDEDENDGILSPNQLPVPVIRDGGLSLIKMLLDRADSPMINIPWCEDGRHEGDTPLHTILQCLPINLPVIQLILDYGGYNRIKNYAGFTPLEIAIKSGFEEIVELLSDYDDKLPPDPPEDECGRARNADDWLHGEFLERLEAELEEEMFGGV